MFTRLPSLKCRFFDYYSTIKRFVHIEIMNLDSQYNLIEGNFDEQYEKMKLPFKLYRYKDNESKAFIKMRIEDFKKGYSPLSIEKYASLYENIECSEKKSSMIEDINMIILYYNNIITKSIFAPKDIPVLDMDIMMNKYSTNSSRIRYIHYLFIREFDIWRRDIEDQINKEKRHKEEEEELKNFKSIGCFDKENNLQYGYWRNTLFGRYYNKSYFRYSLNKLRQAELFGQKFVIDCSFDESMLDYETISVSRQISAIYNANRFSKEPFKLLFTGYNPENRGFKHTKNNLKSIIFNSEYFLNFHKESYTELCKGEHLIYLSPDSKTIMKEFDPNAVYIVGALVSKTLKSRLTFEKAKEQGIECLKLPIHEYVKLKPGVKRVLSFQGVFKILLNLKEHGDWERALRAGIQEHKLID